MNTKICLDIWDSWTLGVASLTETETSSSWNFVRTAEKVVILTASDEMLSKWQHLRYSTVMLIWDSPGWDLHHALWRCQSHIWSGAVPHWGWSVWRISIPPSLVQAHWQQLLPASCSAISSWKVVRICTGIMIILSFFAFVMKQGKSEGFDSWDRPSNLTQIGLKLSISQTVWPWNLMDELEK